MLAHLSKNLVTHLNPYDLSGALKLLLKKKNEISIFAKLSEKFYKENLKSRTSVLCYTFGICSIAMLLWR